MTKPHVTSFVNVLTSAAEPNLSFEEIEVTASCDAAGRSIGELDVARRTGAYIVALRRVDGTLELRPSKETAVAAGDVIVGIGSPDEISRLEQMFAPRDALAG